MHRSLAQVSARANRIAPATVDVCICTYRRPAVADAIRAIAAQHGRDCIALRLIVADNAPEPEARETVADVAAELGLDLLYVHAPANNISVARNACIEAAEAEWIAFIDDDEIAAPRWLPELLAEAQRGAWDAVLGPVNAAYPQSAPAWMREGDFHSTRPVWVRGVIETGYTGNVLMRRAFIAEAGLRFRLELGKSGGEDVEFFYRLRDRGGRIGFAPAALALEGVPDDRATLRWLLKRSFRSGQTHGARLRAQARRPVALLMAIGKAGLCCACAGLFAFAPARRNRYLTRAALHCGVMARLLGWREIRFY